uniref:F-box domain-containing protein n=1 Tax=Macrostomum lignano TaxID=282301 RepID=A0A1I8IC44_9PLAT
MSKKLLTEQNTLPDMCVHLNGVAPAPRRDFFDLKVSLKQKKVSLIKWIITSRQEEGKLRPAEVTDKFEDFPSEMMNRYIPYVFGKDIVRYIEGLIEGNYDWLVRLPDDLLVYLLTFLNLEDIERLSHICTSDALWKKLFYLHMPSLVSPEVDSLADENGWKSVFYSRIFERKLRAKHLLQSQSSEASTPRLTSASTISRDSPTPSRSVSAVAAAADGRRRRGDDQMDDEDEDIGSEGMDDESLMSWRLTRTPAEERELADGPPSGATAMDHFDISSGAPALQCFSNLEAGPPPFAMLNMMKEEQQQQQQQQQQQVQQAPPRPKPSSILSPVSERKLQPLRPASKGSPPVPAEQQQQEVQLLEQQPQKKTSQNDDVSLEEQRLEHQTKKQAPASSSSSASNVAPATAANQTSLFNSARGSTATAAPTTSRQDTRFDTSKPSQRSNLFGSFGRNQDYSNTGFGRNQDYSNTGFGRNQDYSYTGFGRNQDHSNTGFGRNQDYSNTGFGRNQDHSNTGFGRNQDHSNTGFGRNQDDHSNTGQDDHSNTGFGRNQDDHSNTGFGRNQDDHSNTGFSITAHNANTNRGGGLFGSGDNSNTGVFGSGSPASFRLGFAESSSRMPPEKPPHFCPCCAAHRAQEEQQQQLLLQPQETLLLRQSLRQASELSTRLTESLERIERLASSTTAAGAAALPRSRCQPPSIPAMSMTAAPPPPSASVEFGDISDAEASEERRADALRRNLRPVFTGAAACSNGSLLGSSPTGDLLPLQSPDGRWTPDSLRGLMDVGALRQLLRELGAASLGASVFADLESAISTAAVLLAVAVQLRLWPPKPEAEAEAGLQSTVERSAELNPHLKAGMKRACEWMHKFETTQPDLLQRLELARSQAELMSALVHCLRLQEQQAPRKQQTGAKLPACAPRKKRSESSCWVPGGVADMASNSFITWSSAASWPAAPAESVKSAYRRLFSASAAAAAVAGCRQPSGSGRRRAAAERWPDSSGPSGLWRRQLQPPLKKPEAPLGEQQQVARSSLHRGEQVGWQVQALAAGVPLQAAEEAAEAAGAAEALAQCCQGAASRYRHSSSAPLASRKCSTTLENESGPAAWEPGSRRSSSDRKAEWSSWSLGRLLGKMRLHQIEAMDCDVLDADAGGGFHGLRQQVDDDPQAAAVAPLRRRDLLADPQSALCKSFNQFRYSEDIATKNTPPATPGVSGESPSLSAPLKPLPASLPLSAWASSISFLENSAASDSAASAVAVSSILF